MDKELGRTGQGLELAWPSTFRAFQNRPNTTLGLQDQKSRPSFLVGFDRSSRSSGLRVLYTTPIRRGFNLYLVLHTYTQNRPAYNALSRFLCHQKTKHGTESTRFLSFCTIVLKKKLVFIRRPRLRKYNALSLLVGRPPVDFLFLAKCRTTMQRGCTEVRCSTLLLNARVGLPLVNPNRWCSTSPVNPNRWCSTSPRTRF